MQSEEGQAGLGELSETKADAERSRIDYRTGKRIYLRDTAFWVKHVEQYRRSGESIAVYCQRHDLGRSTLRRWAQRLEGRLPSGRSGARRGSKNMAQRAKAAGFLAVPVRTEGQRGLGGAGSGCDRSTPTMEVWLEGKVCVALFGEAAAQALAKVLAHLEVAAR